MQTEAQQRYEQGRANKRVQVTFQINREVNPLEAEKLKEVKKRDKFRSQFLEWIMTL